jgi:hypothetical protein
MAAGARGVPGTQMNSEQIDIMTSRLNDTNMKVRLDCSRTGRFCRSADAKYQ